MKGKIYKIICKVNKDFCYFGSTIKTLNRRWMIHKSIYKRWKEGKRNNISTHEFYDKYGIENFSIQLIEELIFDKEGDLKKREQYYIDNFNCVNKQAAYTGLTKTEYNVKYCKENKKKIAERMVKYRKDNKEEIAEQRAKYRKDNKEELAERMVKYRKDNKEELSKKITCECGSIVSKWNLAQHKKSNKHQAYLKSLI
jgi:hypothetical protein